MRRRSTNRQALDALKMPRRDCEDEAGGHDAVAA
jgi:hypothetical protein